MEKTSPPIEARGGRRPTEGAAAGSGVAARRPAWQASTAGKRGIPVSRVSSTVATPDADLVATRDGEVAAARNTAAEVAEVTEGGAGPGDRPIIISTTIEKMELYGYSSHCRSQLLKIADFIVVKSCLGV